MTAAEQQALKLIYGATITPEQWLDRIRRGYHSEPYKAENTAYFKALTLLRKVGAGGIPDPVPPPAPTPPPGHTRLGQNVMFCAWDPHAGLKAPLHCPLAITADIHVTCSSDDSDQVRAQKAAAYVAAAKDAASQRRGQHGIVAAWGNQVQIGAQQIRDFAAQIGADYVIFQGESSDEYRTAIDAGATVLVGNSNSWTDAQRADATARVNRGELAFIFETYTNEGDPWPADSSSRGVPPASECLGVGWGKTPYQLADYKPHTKPDVWPTISVYLAEKMSDASWGLL